MTTKQLEEIRAYVAWAESDVPVGRSFEDWHDKSVVYLRLLLRDRAANAGRSVSGAAPSRVNAIAGDTGTRGLR